MKNNSFSGFSTWMVVPTIYLIFITSLFLLPNSQALAGTQLTASTPTSAGNITLSWTASSTWYGANIYENNVKVGGATSPSYTVVGKSNGTYQYYVETCNSGCTRSNTVTVMIGQAKNIKYTYDALGRLVCVNDTVNGDRNYQYDDAGNRENVSLSNCGN